MKKYIRSAALVLVVAVFLISIANGKSIAPEKTPGEEPHK